LEIVPTKTISTFLFHYEEEMPGQRTPPYRYEATTIEGFVQQLAVQYVARGYWFYVSGIVPEGKDSRAVAEKLIAKYNIGVSKFVRARRKLNGAANLQLILYGGSSSCWPLMENTHSLKRNKLAFETAGKPRSNLQATPSVSVAAMSKCESSGKPRRT
jgi:hypothetical protein